MDLCACATPPSFHPLPRKGIHNTQHIPQHLTSRVSFLSLVIHKGSRSFLKSVFVLFLPVCVPVIGSFGAGRGGSTVLYRESKKNHNSVAVKFHGLTKRLIGGCLETFFLFDFGLKLKIYIFLEVFPELTGLCILCYRLQIKCSGLLTDIFWNCGAVQNKTKKLKHVCEYVHYCRRPPPPPPLLFYWSLLINSGYRDSRFSECLRKRVYVCFESYVSVS